MNHKKWVHNFFFYALSIIGLIALAIMVTHDAGATERNDRNFLKRVPTIAATRIAAVAATSLHFAPPKLATLPFKFA